MKAKRLSEGHLTYSQQTSPPEIWGDSFRYFEIFSITKED